MQTRTKAAGFTALCIAIVVVASACGNSGSTNKTSSTIAKGGSTPSVSIDPNSFKQHLPVTAPGVTDKEIRVAAVVTKTNPATGGDYSVLADGINAYFKMINDGGGLYGRQLRLTSVRDDQLGQNAQSVQASLSSDKAFATFVATILFTGAKALARANQPTFIWNINPEFTGNNNMFADKGALCFKCPGHILPWIAKQLGATKVGIIAYGVSAESTDCADGIRASFAKYPTATIAYEDKSLPFAAGLAAQVTAMKNAGVQLVGTCIDGNESFTLGKEMKRQGMTAVQELPNGYDPDFVSKNADVFENAIVSPQFVAFEQQPRIPEIQKLYEWAQKIGKPVREVTAAGWVLADEFVTGLKLAGPSFSQQKVIDALNTLTSYTDNGFIQPIDWTKQHQDPLGHPEFRSKLDCGNFVKVTAGKFVPVYAEPDKPWVCFNRTDLTVDTPQHLSFVTP